MALNRWQGIGNVGRDAEVRAVGENKVANFSLAVSEKYKDRNGQQVEKTEWLNCVAWRGLADVAERFFKKGTKLYIEGKLTTRSWETESGEKRFATEIVVQSFEFAGGNSSQSSQGQSNTSSQRAATTNPPIATDDDLPF